MSEIRGRGYMLSAMARFLREKVGEAAWAEMSASFSPELQKILVSGVDSAGWYEISLMNEIIEHVVEHVGANDSGKAKDILYECGQYAASAAANSFLRVLLKMLTPALLVKKADKLLRRDFSEGRMQAELGDNCLKVHLIDVKGLPYIGGYGPGFVAFSLEAMGKRISNVEFHDWDLERPRLERVGFTIHWAA